MYMHAYGIPTSPCVNPDCVSDQALSVAKELSLSSQSVHVRSPFIMVSISFAARPSS